MDRNRFWTALLLAGKCLAESHHLFTSSFTTPHLYALEFDDERNSLIEVANMTAHDGHPWLSFSYDKSSLYAGENGGFASYTVQNASSLLFSQSIKVNAECGGRKDGLASPYVVAELRTPFTVFGASPSSCGAAMSVDSDGTLVNIVQAYKYKDGSSIKGMALDPENKYLYSADEAGNGIWTHLINEKGTLNQVGFTASPYPDSGPRHLVAHPDGRYLYVILSKLNSVAVFAINSGAGSENTHLTYTGVSYSLTPPGAANTDFTGDDVLLNIDANVLFATTRYTQVPAPRPPPTPKQVTPPTPKGRPQPVEDDDDDDDRRRRYTDQATRPGYITAILLTSFTEQENPLPGRLVGSGFPIRPIFQLATTTSGGNSNSISPAPWSSEFFAVADSEMGLIEIWKINNLGTANYTGELAEGAKTKATGGWQQNNWSAKGTLNTVEPADNTDLFGNRAGGKGQPQPKAATNPKSSAVPAWAPPKQTSDPWAAKGPKTPTPTPAGKGQGASPWSRGGDEESDWRGGGDRSGAGRGEDDRRGKGGDQRGAKGGDYNRGGDEDRGARGGRDRDDDEDERRRYLATGQEPTILRRATENAAAPITARIVASWKAPAGGGTPGRRYTDTVSRVMAPGVLKVRPWVGSKKRSIEGAEAPGASQDQTKEYIKAQEEGRSCCTNAAWFD